MDYPLVIETGETFLTHGQLLYFIREKCGDAVANYLSGFLLEDQAAASNMEALKKLKAHLDGIGNEISELEAEIAWANGLMEKMGVE